MYEEKTTSRKQRSNQTRNDVPSTRHGRKDNSILELLSTNFKFLQQLQLVDHGEWIDYKQLLAFQDYSCNQDMRECVVMLETQWGVDQDGFQNFWGRSGYPAMGKALLNRAEDGLQMYVEI